MYCLDTNIVIFALNKRKPWIAERLGKELASGTPLIVPSVVLFELDYGIAKSQRPEHGRRLLDAFLATGFEHPAFDMEDAREAADIRACLERAGTPIGAFDYLIAAQARRRGAVLVTLNRREFERVARLAMTDWSPA
jgi:tRNA(fMet)-specific endonuclease VapC